MQPPDYAKLLKILCGNAKGRVYLATSKAVAEIMKVFSAGRMGAEYAKAMNAVVAVDFNGDSLTTACISPIIATHVVHGRFGSEHLQYINPTGKSKRPLGSLLGAGRSGVMAGGVPRDRKKFAFVGDDGAPLPMTLDNIARVRNGNLLRGTSGESKCDRLNVEWSKRK